MNAQARGVRAAKLYKKTKSKLIVLDQYCVQKASKHKLPAWTGHLPVITLTGALASAMIFGSLLIICISLFVFALILISSISPQIRSVLAEKENGGDDDKDGLRSGFQGTGYYMGGYRMDGDDE